MFNLNTLSAALAATLLLSTPSSAAPSPEKYSLVNSYSGKEFFQGWSWWDQADPTQGFVSYQNREAAMQQNLAGFIYNNATGEHTTYLSVDHTTMKSTAGRASVRITSEQAFDGGLFVADVRHMPEAACGSWPALWLVGPDWPHNGEIDIIEGVNELFGEYNSMTLHTGPGCASHLPQKKFLGEQVTNDCDVSTGTSNTGCSIHANSSQTYNPRSKKTITHATSGTAFNKAGGGVYATLHDASGIKIWMFPHNAVPADLVAGTPKPETWTAKPVAQFGGDGCDYAKSFKKLQIVINLTFCGQWAGEKSVWSQSSCSAKAGASTCETYTANNPAAFKDVFFEIGSISVFQTAKQQQASGTSPSRIPTENGGDEDADCMHMTATSTNSTSTSAPAASSTASANVNSTGYGNSTNFTALHSYARRSRGMARLLE